MSDKKFKDGGDLRDFASTLAVYLEAFPKPLPGEYLIDREGGVYRVVSDDPQPA